MSQPLSRRMLSVLAVLILAGIGAAACSGAPTASTTPNSQLPATSESVAPTSAADPSGPGDLRAVLCVPDEDGWTTFDVQQRKLAVDPLAVPGATGDCTRYITAAAGNGSNGTVAGLYIVSHDLRNIAEYMSENQDQDAGYQPATDQTTRDSGSFIDASGNKPDSFSQSSNSDGQVLFNPASGKLWWVDGQDDDMHSNTVPPGVVTNEGPGFLSTFTPTGVPMPMPYYDSPDGSLRAVFTPDDESTQVNIGPTASMTQQCLQSAELAAISNSSVDLYGPQAGFCGSSIVVDASGEEAPDSACATFVGWISDTAVACISQDSTAIDSFPINSNGQLGNPTDLLPATTQTISDALVTPDGSQVLLFLKGNQGFNLYLVPTAVSQPAATPVTLHSWAGGGEVSLGILGWILPSGQWEV